MTTNELKVLSIIWNWGGEASIDIIAREAGISIDYARLLCESLGRESCIDFLHSKLCKIKSRGKLQIAGVRGQNLYFESKIQTSRLAEDKNRPRKIIISRVSKFGLGKNKKGSLTLNY